ncbi:DNA polymerase (plasmid) [Haloarcula sp. CBA1115]|uniref:DNA polymerase n=1 Tax=unclassified Haloarcula TaxID=2624677 RepID=UPI00059551C1|nr:MULTISPECIES: DNA polymerase [unclassified Haloarcula]AJF28048.1 DNA polymerase [Haloarcula sp. CBA1115]
MSQSTAASSTEAATTDAEESIPETSAADETQADIDSTDLLTLDAPKHLQISGEVQLFERIFSAAGTVTDKTRLGIAESGIAIRAADQQGHSMVDLRVSGSSFSTFDAGTGTLGVDVGRVRDALSIGDAGDLAQFALDAANSTLEVDIEGITRTIELDPVESLRYPVEMPDIDIPATVHLSPDDISLGLDAADMLDDRFDLSVDPESGEMQFAADGDTDSMTYRREDTDLIAFEPADVEVKLDSSLVKSANAGLPDGTNRVLRIGNEVPLVLKSEFPDADGAMQFVIAPKLPN